MIRKIKRYFAIRSYVRRLGPELVRRFGKKHYYTLEHVQAAVHRGGFGKADIGYAYAMFCSLEEFSRHQAQTGEILDFVALRKKVAGSYFGGNIEFGPASVIDYAESFGEQSGHGSHDDAGGHDGGGHH